MKSVAKVEWLPKLERLKGDTSVERLTVALRAFDSRTEQMFVDVCQALLYMHLNVCTRGAEEFPV